MAVGYLLSRIRRHDPYCLKEDGKKGQTDSYPGSIENQVREGGSLAVHCGYSCRKQGRDGRPYVCTEDDGKGASMPISPCWAKMTSILMGTAEA